MTAIPAADLARLDPDEPVPYTLTLLGYVALAVDELRLADEPGPTGEWSCGYCGAAYFGPRPDDGLCQPCRTVGPGPVCTGPAATREIPACEREW